MQSGSLHTFLPRLASLIYAAELPEQYCIEAIDVLLCPFNASRHHDRRETGLKDESRILDYGEIDKRYLVDVDVQVAVKYALSG